MNSRFQKKKKRGGEGCACQLLGPALFLSTVFAGIDTLTRGDMMHVDY